MVGRDLVGYGREGFDPKWPDNKKLAVQFVINYEEGGENCILNGDKASEHLLSDIVGATPYVGERNMNMESLYEYGSRVGFWRLHRAFTERKIPVTGTLRLIVCTPRFMLDIALLRSAVRAGVLILLLCVVYAVGLALEKNPDAGKAMVEAGWEVASHGYRWIDYQNVDEATEREHIRKTIEVHEKVIGKRPVGIYQGKPNVNTRRFVVEEGGFLYDSDAYNDDLPYWNYDFGRPHLVIPYTLNNNDMKFVSFQGFNSGDQFFTYLKDAFDVLLAEGRGGHPKMMSIGLHCRVVAHPGRLAALLRFLDYVQSFNDVWICKREEIARHWYKNHFPQVGPQSAKL